MLNIAVKYHVFSSWKTITDVIPTKKSEKNKCIKFHLIINTIVETFKYSCSIPSKFLKILFPFLFRNESDQTDLQNTSRNNQNKNMSC